MTSWQAAICASSLQRAKALSTYPRNDFGNPVGCNVSALHNVSFFLVYTGRSVELTYFPKDQGAGFAAAVVVELSLSVFGKFKPKFEAILGFVGICNLLTLRVSSGGTVCAGVWLFEAAYPPLTPGTEQLKLDALETERFSVPGAQLTSDTDEKDMEHTAHTDYYRHHLGSLHHWGNLQMSDNQYYCNKCLKNLHLQHKIQYSDMRKEADKHLYFDMLHSVGDKVD
nr:hypothetical protein Iba_chr05fCG12230 [Ipomoea batatas]